MNLEFLQTHPFCYRIFIFDQTKSKYVILFFINWQATELEDKQPLIWPHPSHS